MINGKKIALVLPAYNAEATLRKTVEEIPTDVIDFILLVDDCSADGTVKVAHQLGLSTIVHDNNLGYGGNQKTCYREALSRDADIVVMLHPDYQYTPRLVSALASMIAYGEYDLTIGSRVLAQSAVKRGMPVYKYISNRLLTFVQNIFLGQKLSEYHTGFRAFSRAVLESLPLGENSDDFIFDNQMLAQAIFFDFRIGELSCPTRYAADSSSISVVRSIKYGLGVIAVSLQYVLAKSFNVSFRIFDKDGKGI